MHKYFGGKVMRGKTKLFADRATQALRSADTEQRAGKSALGRHHLRMCASRGRVNTVTEAVLKPAGLLCAIPT